MKEQAKFSDIIDQFEDGKETEILRAEDQVRVNRRIDALNEKWAELDRVHNENRQRYRVFFCCKQDSLNLTISSVPLMKWPG